MTLHDLITLMTLPIEGTVDVFVTSECIHLYISYCTPMDMFVPPIGRVINVIKSCKVIEVNPPLYVGELDPRVSCIGVIRIS